MPGRVENNTRKEKEKGRKISLTLTVVQLKAISKIGIQNVLWGQGEYSITSLRGHHPPTVVFRFGRPAKPQQTPIVISNPLITSMCMQNLTIPSRPIGPYLLEVVPRMGDDTAERRHKIKSSHIDSQSHSTLRYGLEFLICFCITGYKRHCQTGVR